MKKKKIIVKKVQKKKGVKAKPVAPKKVKSRRPKGSGHKMSEKKPVRMSDKDLHYFEKLINGKRTKLLEELGYMKESSLAKSAQEATGDLSNYSYHMADQASDAVEREQNFQLAQREGEFLHHLNEALYRIKKGVYGICKSCGGLIAKERLEAVPHTTMCIRCKSADQERKRRGLEEG